MKKTEILFAIIIIILLITAWFFGSAIEERRLKESINNSMPQSVNIKNAGNGIFISELYGTVTAIASSPGYGGPLRVATSVDIKGNISRISIISNKETFPFYEKLTKAKYPAKLLGKNYSEKFISGDDVDSVSGATLSLRALTDAVRKGAVKASVEGFGLKNVENPKTPFLFGFKEILLLLLLITGFLNYSKLIGFRIKKYLKWSALLSGMIFLGFVYTVPLSIININSFLMGFWPDWHHHLFWYMLLLGVFLPLIIAGKSPYCDSFCPFGSAQELLKLTGGGKKKVPLKVTRTLGFVQKSLALGIVTAALLFRDPGFGNYEVFGTFFKFTGNNMQYAIMAVIVLLSLFFTRPWCNYLCPLRAVSDFIKKIRKMIIAKN